MSPAKRILVIGAAGFIGSHLSIALRKAGHQLYLMDGLVTNTYSREEKLRRWNLLKERLGNTTVFLEANLLHAENLLKDVFPQVDVVFNLAAYAGLQPSWDKPEVYILNNVTTTQILLGFLRQFPRVRLVHASTSSVYGRIAEGHESSTLDPISPYGITKLAAEQLIKTYSVNFGIQATILRYFSVYGPGQRPDMAYSIFIRQILANRVLQIYGSGLQRRTNTFIDDCVRATLACVNLETTLEVINIGGGESVSILEAISVMENIIGKKAQIEFRESKIGDQVETKADTTKASRLLGFSPKVNFKDGMTRQVNSILNSSFFA
jgi:nucleoside-diphosphate-sugar epimerase